jgi:RNA polymerase sigma-70 factor (ECF subfamily)
MAIYIDDRELVAAHRAGDSKAFDELVREHQLPLLAHANRKLHCDASADDALQETLVRAYRALPKFSGEYRLGPWLHRIMANVCVDEAVRRRRDSEKLDKYALQPTQMTSSPSAEEELGLNFDDTSLKAAIDDLPDPHREALVLRFVDELEYSQVAERVGVSEPNARARVSRARSAVRSTIKGVAVLPVLLFGLLKRGEKAAAAATAGSTMTSTAASAVGHTASAGLPTLAEATTVVAQAAPTVMPVIVKAAVGIGLAAAVFAPTDDSAVHHAMANMVSPGFGVDAAQSLNELDGGLIASSGGLPSDPSNLTVTLAGDLTDPNTAKNATQSGLTGQSSVALETLTPSIATSNTNQRSVQANRGGVVLGANSQTALSGETLNVTLEMLSLDPVGPERFDLSGRLALNAKGVERSGELQLGSTLRLAPGSVDAERRIEALLVMKLDRGDVVEIRLAGLTGEGTTGLTVAGLYRAIADGDSALADGGWFTALLDLEGPAGTGSCVLTLES